MSDKFYGTEQEIKRQQERASKKPAHTTMEAYKLEKDRHQTEKPYSPDEGDVEPPEPTLLQKLGQALRNLFGGR